jgi:uncharacterized membrane protein
MTEMGTIILIVLIGFVVLEVISYGFKFLFLYFKHRLEKSNQKEE